MRAAIIPVSGAVRIESVPTDRLPWLQAAVGGWIEAVSVTRILTDEGARRAPCTVWVNEEGKLYGLPTNPRATDQCAQTIGGRLHDVISGDVLDMGPPDAEGNETTVPAVVLDIMREWGWPIETSA